MDADLIDAERGKSSRHDARGSQNIPPIEQSKRNPFDDGVQSEDYQDDQREDLNAHWGPSSFLSHDEKHKEISFAAGKQNHVLWTKDNS